jgi:general secretion pathway protein K
MNKIFRIHFQSQQQGVILIIVLWFIVIISVLVAALATETRLTAEAVFRNQESLQTWNDTLKALRIAEMELLLTTMPATAEDEERQEYIKKGKNWAYRFDGRILNTAYPLPETVTVRIYDHAGRINVQRLTLDRMRELLEKQVGNDPEPLQALTDAWQDWIDTDDLKRQNGTEKEYYKELSPPYEPRNRILETVEELLLIKGFAEIFKPDDLGNAFTVHSNSWQINPNLATREALVLLPGMTEAMAEAILVQRRKKEFKNIQGITELEVFKEMELEQRNKFLSWMYFSTSNFYTIAIQVVPPKPPTTDDETEAKPSSDHRKATQSEPPTVGEKQFAYMVTVQTRGTRKSPKILRVDPYGVLPDSRHERVPIEEDED